MNELVLANLRTRPFRTFIAVVGVALGVVLVILFTGLARGMSNDMAKRASNWKAEIVFTRPGSFETSSSNASVNTKYVERLVEIEGVESAVPIIRYFVAGTGSFGLRQIDGVDWDGYARMNEMRIVRGSAAVANDEVILDEREAGDLNVDVGGTINLFGNKPYKVVGVFAPPSGARTKMSLTALQDILQAPGKCSYILVKIKEGISAETVAARINEELPGNKINLTQDLIVDAEQRFPALKNFLRTLVGLGAFVSFIFVLLSMYTTVTERRREIGILKSLGASQMFIVGTIEFEALLIGILGAITGFAVAFAAAFLIQNVFNLAFEYNTGWMLTAIALAIVGSLVGALYPAWRASSLDVVQVLTNE
ncbi:MAG TPA: ABC transporter permease [Pyrinomonadaceae bacterium]|jgi:putative ABC transport system permease protein